MKKIIYLVPTLSLVGCTSQHVEEKPNVIVILADDLGFGDVSAYGSTTIHTPNIDSLAHGGVCFTNGYATSATSTPSRYALMTGMYPWKNKDAKILPGDAPLIINENQFTLPKMMQQCGYVTGAIGKWHLGMGEGNVNWNETVKPGAKEIGFDYSCLIAATNDRVPTVYVENGDVVGLDPADPIEVSYEHNFEGEPTAISHPEMLKMQWAHGHNNSIVNGIPRIGYMKGGQKARWKDEDMADYFVDKVKNFVTEHKDAPFFLYFATQDAHVPRVPSPQFVGKSGMGPRGDCLLEFDWSVGQVLDALERLGLDKNTLVVLSSDNGPVVDDGYKDQAVELLGDHKPGGVYRGGKYSAYEAGTRVPCIWSWQGVIRPGTVSDALLCQIDWFATFAQMMNFRLPEGAAPDSEPLLNAWTGKEKKGREWLVLQNAQNNLSVTDGRWKYLRPGKGPAYNKNVNIELGNSMKPQLYDIKKDPAEKNNVAEKNPKIVTKMSEQLEKIVDGRYGLPL